MRSRAESSADKGWPQSGAGNGVVADEQVVPAAEHADRHVLPFAGREHGPQLVHGPRHHEELGRPADLQVCVRGEWLVPLRDLGEIFGERHGTIATALIGGAYSSTAVTQSLAQRLGSETKGGAEPAGIALATAVMYLRIPILIAVLATRVLPAILILLLPALLVAWGAGYWLYRKAPKADAPAPPEWRPRASTRALRAGPLPAGRRKPARNRRPRRDSNSRRPP